MLRRVFTVVGVSAVALTASAGAVSANTGNPAAQLAAAAITASGPVAVGGDSMNFYISPPCGSALAEHQVPTGWQDYATPSPSCAYLTSVAAIPGGGAWAVGYSVNSSGDVRTLIERFNGTKWSVVASPNPGGENALNGVVVAGGTAWAVGVFEPSGSPNPKTLILKNTGSGWTPVASPNPGYQNSLSGITVTPQGAVWAVGWKWLSSDFAYHSLIVRLGSTGWTAVNAPSPGGSNSTVLEDVGAGPGGALWAVGEYNQQVKTLTLSYSSGTWKQVPSPSPGTSNNYLYAVRVAPNGNVWAVGGRIGSTCEQTLSEKHTAAGWSTVPSPNRGACSSSNPNALNGLAVNSAGKLYAVGVSDISTLVETNAGSGWSIIPSAN